MRCPAHKHFFVMFLCCIVILLDGVFGVTAGEVVNVYKRWKIGNIGYNVQPQQLKWQQIGNTIGNNRQQPSRSSACHQSPVYQFFIDLRFRVPSLAEQQRIAACLSSLDDLVTAQTQKLDALKTHKKGLMQQLFPSPAEVEALARRKWAGLSAL